MAIAWGALLASISRRWLRVTRARPAARTRPRPPPFSGVSVSGSDTRSQGRGSFLHPPCVQSLSFSLYLTLPFLFSVTSFSPLPVSLVFRSFPFANRCLSLARVATFGRTWWRTPCVRAACTGGYAYRVSSSSSSCSPVPRRYGLLAFVLNPVAHDAR